MEKKSGQVKPVMGAKSDEPKKLSYEQLEHVASSLNQQCRALQQQLMQAQKTLAEFNEIEVLLEVLKQSEQFSPQFVERCANTIEELVTKALDRSEKQQEEQPEEKN